MAKTGQKRKKQQAPSEQKCGHSVNTESAENHGQQAKPAGAVAPKPASIDALFDEAKSKQRVKRLEAKKSEQSEEARKRHAKDRKKRAFISDQENKRSRKEFIRAKPLRFDAQLGMRIYSEEALGIGKGGGTKDCPFDCNCCF